ncbi:MAG: ABC transporter permease [Endomicrobium sp.]|jgi:ABC-2 type transport system permease protein|nr:ABC transporter permease [Endomicrobium sp.]
MKNILRIIVREIRFIAASKLYILALLAFPIIDCLFLGGIYISGSLTELPIAVIDQDNSKISRNIVRYFDASPDMEIKYRLSNVSELEDLFARQKAFLGIYIPKDLQKNIKRQKPQKIPVYINSSNYIAGNLLDSDVSTIIAVIGAGVKHTALMKRGFSSKQAMETVLIVKNESEKLFNPALDYNLYLTPGLWLSVIQQLLILAGVLTLATEYDFKRLRTALKIARGSLPAALIKVFAAKTVIYMCAAYIHFEILYRIIFPLFKIPIAYSASAAAALSMCFAFACISCGLLLASVLKTRLDALKGCLLISAPAFLLSGYTWPLEQMPVLLQKIMQLIPLAPFLKGFTKIYNQDLGITFSGEFAAHLLVLGSAYFAAAYLIMLLRMRRQKKISIFKRGGEIKNFQSVRS